MHAKTMGRVPNRAAVGWKSPNSSISSNSSNSTSESGIISVPVYNTISTVGTVQSVPPTKPVKAPVMYKSLNQTTYSVDNHNIGFDTLSSQQASKGNQNKSHHHGQSSMTHGNDVKITGNCKKSPMLRRMKMALAEADDKQQMTQFGTNHKSIQSSIEINLTEPEDVPVVSSNWQIGNSTKKGTVKANEDFEYREFPKPPPELMSPPSVRPAVTPAVIQPTVPSFNSLTIQDSPPIEIRRIPLVFKGHNKSPTSPDYKNEKTCVLDELKQKQESGTVTGGPIYKKNRSPMLRRMKLALAHIENESDL